MLCFEPELLKRSSGFKGSLAGAVVWDGCYCLCCAAACRLPAEGQQREAVPKQCSWMQSPWPVYSLRLGRMHECGKLLWAQPC